MRKFCALLLLITVLVSSGASQQVKPTATPSPSPKPGPMATPSSAKTSAPKTEAQPSTTKQTPKKGKSVAKKTGKRKPTRKRTRKARLIQLAKLRAENKRLRALNKKLRQLQSSRRVNRTRKTHARKQSPKVVATTASITDAQVNTLAEKVAEKLSGKDTISISLSKEDKEWLQAEIKKQVAAALKDGGVKTGTSPDKKADSTGSYMPVFVRSGLESLRSWIYNNPYWFVLIIAGILFIPAFIFWRLRRNKHSLSLERQTWREWFQQKLSRKKTEEQTNSTLGLDSEINTGDREQSDVEKNLYDPEEIFKDVQFVEDKRPFEGEAEIQIHSGVEESSSEQDAKQEPDKKPTNATLKPATS